MARPTAPRNLTLTEELERLEQSITLTLQEIDSNFSRAHRIVTTSILPIVEHYAKHSSDVWEGSKFWKQFFEASANVSLASYEEDINGEDVTHTDTTSTNLETPADHGDYGAYDPTGSRQQREEDDDEFTVDSPTQVTGVQTTPKLPSTTKKTYGKAGSGNTAAFRSPSPRKYTGKNPLGGGQTSDEPSTPRPSAGPNAHSSPFEPESAFQPSAQLPRTNNDPLMHRAVLDKNYRIQATPHTQRRLRQQGQPTSAAPVPKQSVPSATKPAPWDDSPQSSPAIAAPQLRSDLFSPAKPNALIAPRTPGISILTPARGRAAAAAGVQQDRPTTSTGRQLFSPQDKAYSAAKSNTRASAHIFSSDDEDSDAGFDDMSPPKTMQFHVPQSRLMQTPAREASRKIVEDLLLTAGAQATDEIEGIDDPSLVDEPSPSVVRRAYEDDSF